MSRVSVPVSGEASLPSRICLAIVLAAGLSVAWGVGLAWAIAIVSTIAQSREPFVQILILADGTPVLRRQMGDGRAPQITTLDGKPYPATNSTIWLRAADLPIETSQSHWTIIRPTVPRIDGYTDARPSPADWFFVQFQKPRSVAYFVGYDRVSRQRVGYLGRAGFQLDEPTAEQSFPVNREISQLWGSSGLITPPGTINGNTPSQYSFQDFSSESVGGKIPGSQLYLVSGDRAYRIDLRARTVGTVMESPGLLDIALFERPARAAVKPMLEDALAVRDDQTVFVLDASGHRDTAYRIPGEFSARDFRFYQMSDGTALAQVKRTDALRRITYDDLVWFTREGAITRRIEGATAWRDQQLSLASMALVVAFAVPTPVGPIGTAFAYPLTPNYYETTARTYSQAVWDELPSITLAVIVAAVLMALAIWLYYRCTARYGERRRAAWVVLIAMLGLPAYFGYVLHRRWPARIRCIACGVPAPRDRDDCLHCGKDFPSPAANGLEIFA